MENVEKHLVQDLPSTKGGKIESLRPIQPFQIDDVMKNFCNETQPEIDPHFQRSWLPPLSINSFIRQKWKIDYLDVMVGQIQSFLFTAEADWQETKLYLVFNAFSGS